MSQPLPLRPIVRAGDWMAISGQIGFADGALVDGGVGAQFHQALTNLRDLLAENGASLEQVVKTTVFLVSMDDYGKMNQVYTEFFVDNPPARSAVAVAELPLGALIEIEAWAYLPDAS